MQRSTVPDSSEWCTSFWGVCLKMGDPKITRICKDHHFPTGIVVSRYSPILGESSILESHATLFADDPSFYLEDGELYQVASGDDEQLGNRTITISAGVNHGSRIVETFSAWWFGCHQFYFPRNIGLISSSQWTNICFRGVAQPPTSFISFVRMGEVL